MNRRQLLLASVATLVCGHAGCIGDGAGTDRDDHGTDGEQQDEFELAVADVGASGEVALDASVGQEITASHPGTLQMELTNAGDEERVFWYIGGTMAPFNQEWLSHEEEDASIVLLVTGLIDHERHGGCWVGSGDDDVRRHAILGPGESLSREVAVASGAVPLGDEEPPEPCLIDGLYSGEQTLDLYASDEGIEQHGEPQGEKIGETTLELAITVSH